MSARSDSEREAGDSGAAPIPLSFDEPAVGLRDLLAVIRRRRLVFLLVLGAMLVLSVAAAILMPKTYRATVLLAPVVDSPENSQLAALAGQFGGLASIAGINIDSGGSREQAVAVLGSRSFTQQFIDAEKLKPILFADRWDAENGQWNVSSAEEIPSEWETFKFFDSEVRTISTRRDDGLITLSIDWTDPVVAANWANELVAVANQQMRNEAIAEAQESIAYLEDQLEKTSSIELKQGIYRLIENNLNKIMLASVREDYAFKVLDEAAPPDPGDFYSPNRKLIVAGGASFGFVLALVLALFVDLRARRTDR